MITTAIFPQCQVCRLHSEIRKQRAEEAKELGNIGEVVKRQEEKEVKPKEYDHFVEDADSSWGFSRTNSDKYQ